MFEVQVHDGCPFCHYLHVFVEEPEREMMIAMNPEAYERHSAQTMVFWRNNEFDEVEGAG
jgi:hypothetical protein